jgi:hypothetical protein
MTFRETLLSVLMGVLAFIGLVIASRASAEIFLWIGYILIVIGVAFIFVMIHRATGRPSHERR